MGYVSYDAVIVEDADELVESREVLVQSVV
jgi:hypothetical protein